MVSPEIIRYAPKSGPFVPVSSSDEEENDVEAGVETVPPPEDTSAAKFVTEMSAKIGNLAPGGSYKVVRPLKYKIDLPIEFRTSSLASR